MAIETSAGALGDSWSKARLAEQPVDACRSPFVERRRDPTRAYSACLIALTALFGDPLGVFWHPWITLDRRLRALIAERMERGASDKLDRLLAALIADRDALQREGWFS